MQRVALLKGKQSVKVAIDWMLKGSLIANIR